MDTIREYTAKGCPKAVLLPGLAADGGVPPEQAAPWPERTGYE
ncbi:MAG: hypothetical protein VB099_19310 [Candidatus Limiplasma sp.]|nr:hypothetical protein [Candidatus Limiplasma sp.]